MLFFLPFSSFCQQNKATAVEKPKPSGNPCINNPCGPFSLCKSIGDTPACSCLPNYIGRAPNCRPECIISAECPSNLACINQKCSDPCVGACGSHTYCSVINHNSVCQCEPGYTGDPFSICTEIRKCKPAFSILLLLFRISHRIRSIFPIHQIKQIENMPKFVSFYALNSFSAFSIPFLIWSYIRKKSLQYNSCMNA